MFDVLVAYEPRTAHAGPVGDALRAARLRVMPYEVRPGERPSSGVRVDVAVACAQTSSAVAALASGIRASVDGPPPVVGVTPDATAPPAGTVDVLRHDAPESLLVARVQRAAVARARQRTRTVLSGDVTEIGLRELLRSLESRRQTGVVRVRSTGQSAEIVVDKGRVTMARADGVDAVESENLGVVLAAIESWTGATFEVHGAPAGSKVSTRPPSPLPSASSPPPLGVDASDVALAAAVMNAVSGYARAFLPSREVVRHLEQARELARRVDSGLDAFSISSGGMVSVTRVALAQATPPSAIAAWCASFFDECARSAPGRFQRKQISTVLGGLVRLLEKVGWDPVTLRFEGTT